MYQYTGCGLEGIFLKNGYTVKETPYGKAVSVDDIEGLHRAIAIDIVSQPTPMTGQQFRFLRKEQDLTQEELAAKVRVDAQTVANWEKKGKSEVPGPADIAIRALYAAYLQRQFDAPEFNDEPVHDRSFEHDEDGWDAAA